MSIFRPFFISIGLWLAVGCHGCPIRPIDSFYIGVNMNRLLTADLTTMFKPMFEDYLQQTLGTKLGKTFKIVPMGPAQAYLYPLCGYVDAVYVNPMTAVCFDSQVGASPLLTQRSSFSFNPANRTDYKVTDYAGGAIIVRSDRSDIQTVADLKDKVLSSGGLHTLSGLPQAYYARAQGQDIFLNAKSITITQDDRMAVYDVLRGNADAGLVASFTLPVLYDTGVINLTDFKILAPFQALDDAVTISGSIDTMTAEYAFMTMPQVTSDQRTALAEALLALQPGGAALKAARVYEWKPAVSYRAAEKMMLNMGILDPVTGWCSWSTGTQVGDSYNVIKCPDGFYKKTLDELEVSCAGVVDCPTNYVVTDFIPGLAITRSSGCICEPCVQAAAEEFSVYVGLEAVPLGSRIDSSSISTEVLVSTANQNTERSIQEDIVFNKCAKSSGLLSANFSADSFCSEAVVKRERIIVKVVDNLVLPRRDGQLNLKPIKTVSFTVVSQDNLKQSTPSTSNVSTAGAGEYAYSFIPRESGLHMIQIFIDGVPLAAYSPLYLRVVPIVCYGGKEVGSSGLCVCPDDQFDFHGTCGPFDTKRVIVFVIGLVLLALLLVLVIHGMLKARSVAAIMISDEDLYVLQPPILLGMGEDGGGVFKGVYRAMEVAVKVIEKWHPSKNTAPTAYNTKIASAASEASLSSKIIVPRRSTYYKTEVESQRSSRHASPVPGPPRNSNGLEGAPAALRSALGFLPAEGRREGSPSQLATAAGDVPLFGLGQTRLARTSTADAQAAAAGSQGRQSVPEFSEGSIRTGTANLDRDRCATQGRASVVSSRTRQGSVGGRVTWNASTGALGDGPGAGSATGAKNPSFLPSLSGMASQASVNNGPVRTLASIHEIRVSQASLVDRMSVTTSSEGSESGSFNNFVADWLLRLFLRRYGLLLSSSFVQEVARLVMLRHKHIINIYGVAAGEKPMLVMELAVNGTLADWIANGTLTLDSENLLLFAFGIASGLSCLHGSRLVHGNLTPSNVFIDADFNTKISGLEFKDKRGRNPRTPVAYQAPELLRGAPCDPASDVYALGMMMYEMLVRRPAYKDQDEASIVEGVLSPEVRQRPEIPPTVAVPMAELLKACWAEDPADRPSARDLALTIQALSLARIEVTTLHANRRTSIAGASRKQLLQHDFPPNVVEALMSGKKVEPTRYDNISIYISDIVGWTDICTELSPEEAVDLLERLYTGFDRLVSRWNLFKIETIGDSYIAVCGIPTPLPDHTRRAAMFALEAREWARTVPILASEPEGRKVNVRIGIHSGSVVASVIGTRNPKYSIYGDTMNVAARMEQSAEHGMVHLSDVTARLLELQSPPGMFEMSTRGNIDIKGKGKMRTQALVGLSNAYLRSMPQLRFEDASVIGTEKAISGSGSAEDSDLEASGLHSFLFLPAPPPRRGSVM